MTLLQVGDHGPGPVHEVFGHDHRGAAIITDVKAVFHQFEGIFPVFHGAVADFELLVQSPELDVSPGHVAHQSLDDEFAVLFRSEKLGPGGFGGPADAAEEVNFPGEVADR